MTVLKGMPAASSLDVELTQRLSEFYERGIIPTLAIIRVGEKPSDIAYENGAIKKAKKIGVQTEKFICDEKIEQEDLLAVIRSVNENRNIHGILLLQPLPDHIDSEICRNAVAPDKDLDCVSDGALGRFFTDCKAFAPCTAESCMELLRYYQIPVEGKKAVIIGRSMVIGKPAALLFLRENATITVCHTKTPREQLKKLCQEADLIVAAAGKAGTVTADMVSPGQTIVDVGINFDRNGKMVGDVEFEPVSQIVENITPVPGGVGSMTTTLLIKHLIDAAGRQL